MPGPISHQDLRSSGEAIKVLSVEVQLQRKKNWCWAACISMTRRFMGAPLSQVKVVEQTFDGDRLDQMAAVTQALRACDLDGDDPFKGPLPYAEIKKEIDAKRPVMCQVEWSEGGSHVVLVIGYGHNDTLAVLDPQDITLNPGATELSGWHAHASLAHALGSGTWAVTYTGIRQRAALIV